MSAYAIPAVRAAAPSPQQPSSPKCVRRHRPPTALQSRDFLRAPRQSRLPFPAPRPTTSRTPIRAKFRDDETPPPTPAPTPAPPRDWKAALRAGAVIEVWSQGELRFAYVTAPYAKGVLARFVQVSSGASLAAAEAKVSFGEIISVWDPALAPTGADAPRQLAADVDAGLRFLKTSLPRSLDLLSAYDALRVFAKSDPRAMQSSAEIARLLFATGAERERARDAAVTVAAAILVAADTIRFKRAGPGKGWRALPASVAVARGRCSFVDTCKSILEHRSSGSLKKITAWSREQLEILRQLEIYAASGTAARGTAATALEALGYEPTDDGAARLLLDIEYWATGTVEKHGGGTTQAKDASENASKGAADMDVASDVHDANSSSLQNGRATSRAAEKTAQWYKTQSMRDWTFPPEILAEARELRASAREKRISLLSSKPPASTVERRNLLQLEDGSKLCVYCIDDKSSRFLDDALSVQLLEGGNVIRVAAHVTDVDEVVKSGSAIDDLARERGQSLYLPLKPLHMLPAAAMDAASFSSTFPTEATTVMIDFDCETEVIRNWEVFASIIPPVKRLNYGQFDLALEEGAAAAQLQEEDCENLRQLAKVAPLLADKLDQRKPRRRQRGGGIRLEGYTDFDDDNMESRSVASVRLVKRSDRSSTNGTVKVAQIVDFCSTGAHAVVGDMLTSAGALIRQFAKENRAHLPEDRGAFSYASRCGTAPLRRYADLAIQRQVKCILFGRQPAGRRRMDELRVWLAKRHSAGERTVAERRRSALFDSLSNHCSQQCVSAGAPYAVLRGQVRSVTISKKGLVKVDVSLDGTGLSTTAEVSRSLLTRIGALGGSTNSSTGRETAAICGAKAEGNGAMSKENILSSAQLVLPSRAKVRVQILNVNTVSQKIQASVIDVLKRS